VTLLSSLRRLIRHHTSARGIAVLVVLALVTATMPRWETHSHAAGDHEHALAELHAADHADHAEEAPVDTGTPAFASTHDHPVAAFAVALPVVKPLELAILPPEVWSAIHRGRTVDSPPGAPPHRPPIA
jgi:hypothetical protein